MFAAKSRFTLSSPAQPNMAALPLLAFTPSAIQPVLMNKHHAEGSRVMSSVSSTSLEACRVNGI